jgi:two-component system phosphate regulon sensor histidine kinase PhoR
MLINENIYDDFYKGDYASLDSLCKSLGAKTETRITVILPSGRVICDTEEDPEEMDNHSDRPEIIEALAGKNGKSIRHSFTLGMDMLYVAIPAIQDNEIAYVLRTSIPLISIRNALSLIYGRITIIAVLLILIIAIISMVLTRRVSRPITELKKGAERFAEGEFEKKIYTTGTHEIGTLADAMNKMAGELHRRIDQLSFQKNEQEAILSSMTEGVIAIDNDGRILSYNLAAEKMLNLAPVSKGKSIREAVINSDFLNFAESTLSESRNIEGEITIYNKNETYMKTQGTPLLDSNNKKIGALIVLNDVTKVHRLEKIRKDFVSNVSHELRTPITSIKGYLETAFEEYQRSGDNVEKFLNTTIRQVDRLNHIIEDLLSLSRIEQTEKDNLPDRESVSMRSLLDSAIQSCETSAAEKNISIRMSCPEDLQAGVHSQLFEQAIINLLENAINYSDSQGEVFVEAYEDNKEIFIKVTDHGIGIERKHLDRIFERFYRVDKARSRSTGGTGLGLAIVKHIIQAQGGTISVESVPGQGSTFLIKIPA